MADVALDLAAFRALFPEFADPATYPDAVLQTRWDNEATLHVSPSDYGDLTAKRRAYAVQLCLAHVLRLSAMAVASAAQGGGPAGVVVGAQVDKVNVTFAPPPSRTGDAWGYWLAQTTYGQQLAAFLAAASIGGGFVGGLPERSAFRKAGGVFG